MELQRKGVNYTHGGFAALKTMVMMFGEVDFSSVNYGGIEPSAALPYPQHTLLMFTIFVLIVPIIVMNHLVTFLNTQKI